ncbi:cysteine repeat modular protein 3, putative [Plasmodium ovale]|uniref:Cysteine repeat modular protein 3, putative n=1 Tax=Plasmodium ovale TaxID=36330 RepID=A0A1D3TM40_PLAOA|nr:cysteine repeat modular protein 3, putative [Plasmodium ovale]
MERTRFLLFIAFVAFFANKFHIFVKWENRTKGKEKKYHDYNLDGCNTHLKSYPNNVFFSSSGILTLSQNSVHHHYSRLISIAVSYLTECRSDCGRFDKPNRSQRRAVTLLLLKRKTITLESTILKNSLRKKQNPSIPFLKIMDVLPGKTFQDKETIDIHNSVECKENQIRWEEINGRNILKYLCLYNAKGDFHLAILRKVKEKLFTQVLLFLALRLFSKNIFTTKAYINFHVHPNTDVKEALFFKTTKRRCLDELSVDGIRNISIKGSYYGGKFQSGNAISNIENVQIRKGVTENVYKRERRGEVHTNGDHKVGDNIKIKSNHSTNDDHGMLSIPRIDATTIKETRIPRKKNSLLKNIELSSKLIGKLFSNAHATFSNEIYLRSANVTTNLFISGRGIHIFGNKSIIIYDSFVKCEGSIIANVYIAESTYFYILTNRFKINKVGTFIICIDNISSYIPVGKITVQSRVIEQLTTLTGKNRISTFNCATSGNSVLIHENGELKNIILNNKKELIYKFYNYLHISKYLPKKINIIACSVYSEYIALLDTSAIIIASKDLTYIQEVIIHHLNNPIDMCLDKHVIYVTDGDRKNIFQYVSLFILAPVSSDFSMLSLNQQVKNMAKRGGGNDRELGQTTSQQVENSRVEFKEGKVGQTTSQLVRNSLLQTIDNMGKLETQNGQNFVLRNIRILRNIIFHVKKDVKLVGLLDENVTLTYPTGIVAVGNRIYFVDTVLHVLFCYSLKTRKIIQMFGYLNSPVKSNSGLNRPYSLSLYYSVEGKKNLLFLSELSSSRILIFEIIPYIKLYMIYNDLDFNIITDIVATSLYLVVCGLRMNKENVLSYITFIKMEDLSNINIVYNEFPQTLNYGKMTNITPLVKSSNIIKFRIKQYDYRTKKIINTGLNVHKISGVISGKIKISALFDIQVTVYNYFKKIVLTFRNIRSSCPKGYYSHDNKCIICPIGHYTIFQNEQKCVSCEKYKLNSTTLHSRSHSKSECLCKPGYYLKEENICEKCPAGFYKNTVGDFKCHLTCENTKSSSVERATSYEELKCACKDGYFTQYESECHLCPYGSYCLYNPKGGIYKADIIPCKDNATTLHRGSSSPNQCVCYAGYFYNEITKECELCSTDTYKMKASNDLCVSFVENPTYTQEFLPNENYIKPSNINMKKTSNIIFAPRKGSTSYHDAILCESGYFYSYNRSICSLCRYNNYCPGLDNAIISCPKNSVTKKLKNMNPLDCLCEKGFGRITIDNLKSYSVSCEPCPYDTFQPHHSSGECIPCPAYTFTNYTQSTSITDCLPKEGYYNVFFRHIFEYTENTLKKYIPKFLQQYRLYLNSQYERGLRTKGIRETHNRVYKEGYYRTVGRNDTDKSQTGEMYKSEENTKCRYYKGEYAKRKDPFYTDLHKKVCPHVSYYKTHFMTDQMRENKAFDMEEESHVLYFPKIRNNIRNLTGTYSNAFRTNYLKNIILMDMEKIHQFIQQSGDILYLHKAENGRTNLLCSNEKRKSINCVKNAQPSNHIVAIPNYVQVENEVLKKKGSNVEKKSKRKKHAKNEGEIQLHVLQIKDMVNKIKILSYKREDAIKVIKMREEMYIANNEKDIIYECFEIEKRIILEENVYVSTVNELDLTSCLNTCISNLYCTGVEMDKTDKGKTNLFFFLYRSSGKEKFFYYKCNLYFYEELSNYYKKRDRKKIKNIQEYNDEDRITGCTVQKNETLNVWKVYTFETCPNNYYCIKKSFRKKKCPINSVKKSFKGTLENCLCLPGYYPIKKNINRCMPCQKGTYKDSVSNEICVKCPLNLTTTSEASISVYDCVCREGYYFQGDNIIQLIYTKGGDNSYAVSKSSWGKKVNLAIQNYNAYSPSHFVQIKSLRKREKFLKKSQKVLDHHMCVEGSGTSSQTDAHPCRVKGKTVDPISSTNFAQRGDAQLVFSPDILASSPDQLKTVQSYASGRSTQFSSNKHEKYGTFGRCIKCPREMFCPGLWLKKFEYEIHHPPIFCPEGSVIPKTTVEATDINKCICGKGYGLILENNRNTCVKCKERYYKDVVDNSLCAGLCMEFSTSFKGSISKKQCFCERGKYMINESPLEMKCISCFKGALCIGGLKYKSLKKLIENRFYTDIQINDHTLPFPQKGYFSTFQINHEDFPWTPLNALNIKINNFDKADLIVKKQNMLDAFRSKIKYITIENRQINGRDNGSKLKQERKYDSFLYNSYTTEDKNVLIEDGIKSYLVTENGGKIKYKNNYLTVDRIPDFHECPIRKRCVGGVNNLCYEGSEGYLCNNCSKNYDTNHFRSQCFKCKKEKKELLNLIICKIFFYIFIFFLFYINYFCYIKRNFVFIGIFKIWYSFVICFLPFIFMVESNPDGQNSLYVKYFQFFITLPMRFIVHYFKLNCFASSYTNQKYIYIWYIQRFVKIAEPIIDCTVLTVIFSLFYLIYTLLNNKKITTVQRVIENEVNKNNTTGYCEHVSDFYYHYYQKGVIDTISNKFKGGNAKFCKWKKNKFMDDSYSSEDITLCKKKKKKEFYTKKGKEEWGNKQKKENRKFLLGKNNFYNNKNTSSCESFSSKANLLKENKSSSFEDMINFNKHSLKEERANCSEKENIAKDTYWTFMCLLNIYNIRVMGLFRYIHPNNISIFTKLSRILSDFKAVYIIVLYIHFPFILMSLLELVWCQSIKYKNQIPILILYHMPSQVCDFRNKLFFSGVLFSSFFFFIYIFLFIKYLCETKKDFKVFTSYAKQLRGYFLFNGYNYQNRCWDFVNLVKLLLVMVSFMCQLYRKGSNSSEYFICCCTVLILITEVTLTLLYSPYDKRSNNILQKLSLLSTFSILITYLSVQISFFFSLSVMNILPFILFVYFHIYTLNKIVLEFAIYKNILARQEIPELLQKRVSEGLLNEDAFFAPTSGKRGEKGPRNRKHGTRHGVVKGDSGSGCESGCYSDCGQGCGEDSSKKKKKNGIAYKDYNLFDFLLRVNKIPFYSISFNEKKEEIFFMENSFGEKKKEEATKRLNGDVFVEQNTTVIGLNLLHSDLLYYNLSEYTNGSINHMNYVDLKKSNSDLSNIWGNKKLSNELGNFLKTENNYLKKKENNINDEMQTESLKDSTRCMNIKHFINCLIEAINILFINQSYNHITVEWLSFVTRFSLCFIHWMKNHDENLVNLVPLSKKEFELKKRNLLFYSLFCSYTEMYSLYSHLDKYQKFSLCKENFIQAENLEMLYTHLRETNTVGGNDKGNNVMSDSYTPTNFLDDEFYRCEQDIITMLFDDSIFKNLSVSLVEFYFAIYMIQFIESKRLSILIFLFCEKKKYLSREKQYIKMIAARKEDVQDRINDPNCNKVQEFVEYNYLKEYNSIMKKKIKKLQKLIKKKEESFVKNEKMKSIIHPQKDKMNKISNFNTYFVRKLKNLLEETPTGDQKTDRRSSIDEVPEVNIVKPSHRSSRGNGA